MTQHTPGPWMLAHMQRLRRIDIIAGQQVFSLVRTHPTPWDEFEANARLIAAAPDLLATLKRIADEPCGHGPQDFCPRELAHAAIAKATGPQVQ